MESIEEYEMISKLPTVLFPLVWIEEGMSNKISDFSN